MAANKGVNSYATLEEAEAYFQDRLDTAAWSNAPTTQREQALVTATMLLDNLVYLGVAVSESQLLAHPRYGEYFDPRQGRSVSFNGEVPRRVIVALFELAYHLLNNDGLLDSTGSVESLELGAIKLDKISGAKQIPPIVYKQIRPMLSNAHHSWWRAN